MWVALFLFAQGFYEQDKSLKTRAAVKELYLRMQDPDRQINKIILPTERLQGFPDGWTEGLSRVNRWFALGNAVNCDVSRYLFQGYLPKAWWN